MQAPWFGLSFSALNSHLTGPGMDCCSGARHGFLGACHKKKQPFPDICVKKEPVRLHQLVRVRASLKIQDCKAFITKSELCSFSEAIGAEWRPSASRRLASRHANTNTNLNRPSENQVNSPFASNADCSSTKCNETNGICNSVDNTTITQLPSSVNSTNIGKSGNQNNIEESSKLVSNSTIETAKTSGNRSAGKEIKELSVDEINSPSIESTNTSSSRKADEQKETTSLPASLTDEMTKPGPLMEIHDQVSGKNGGSPNSDSASSLSHLLASRNIIEFLSRFPSWADAQKESGMPQRQRRAFYSHEDWLRHRSSLRYIRHVLSSVSSRVIVSLVPPVFTFTAGAIVVATYNTALKYGYLPSFLPLLHAASLPYELTAPALALLLVFRTDASYSRYDEARKTWTSVISTTKDLARLSTQLIKSSKDVALKSSLLSYIMAFPVSLKCHLIHGSDTKNELQRLLQHDDLAFVLSSQHRPNCLIQLISQALNLLHLENTDRVLLVCLLLKAVDSFQQSGDI